MERAKKELEKKFSSKVRQSWKISHCWHKMIIQDYTRTKFFVKPKLIDSTGLWIYSDKGLRKECSDVERCSKAKPNRVYKRIFINFLGMFEWPV